MRLTRTLRVVAAAMIAVFALISAACSSSDDSSGSAGKRAVSTAQGSVEIPAKPQRVVVVNHALAGYLFDLDVPVVGVTTQATDEKGKFGESWADDAKDQGTELISWTAEGFDKEAILALEPDLIIGGGQGFPLKIATASYRELSQIAPTVLVAGDLDTWQKQFAFLANDVFARPDVYNEAVAKYDARLEEVKTKIKVPEGEAVFLSMLADGRAFVLIEDRGLAKDFARLGFRPAPLFASGKYKPYTPGGDSFELSTEQIGQVLTQSTLFQAGFNADVTSVAAMRQQPIFAALPSFQKNQAYDLPYWAQRGDYDDSLAVLDIIEEKFAK